MQLPQHFLYGLGKYIVLIKNQAHEFYFLGDFLIQRRKNTYLKETSDTGGLRCRIPGLQELTEVMHRHCFWRKTGGRLRELLDLLLFWKSGCWLVNLDLQNKKPLWELYLCRSLIKLPAQQFPKCFDDVSESDVCHPCTSYKWINPVHFCRMLCVL